MSDVSEKSEKASKTIQQSSASFMYGFKLAELSNERRCIAVDQGLAAVDREILAAREDLHKIEEINDIKATIREVGSLVTEQNLT